MNNHSLVSVFYRKVSPVSMLGQSICLPGNTTICSFGGSGRLNGGAKTFFPLQCFY